MKRRSNLFVVMILFSALSYTLQAQTNYPDQQNRRSKWLLDVTTGANINLIQSNSAPEAKLLESRASIVPLLGFRSTFLFSGKLGGYARFQINFYNSRKSEYNPSGNSGEIIKMFFDELFPVVRKIHPSLDAGIIYRIEQNRWSFHPGIGIGYMMYLPDIESSRSWKRSGSDYKAIYTQHASSLFVNLGLSTRYSFSHRSSLVLDINFQQPLQKSSAGLIVHTDKVESERKSFQTSTAGRNLNISIGYGLTF